MACDVSRLEMPTDFMSVRFANSPDRSPVMHPLATAAVMS